MPRRRLPAGFFLVRWMGIATLLASGWASATPLLHGQMPVRDESRMVQAVERIKGEGFQRSQVMEWLGWLTDAFGPRLTGSPRTAAAGEWVVDQLEEWGMANPRKEWWGPFAPGWDNERTVVHVTEPVPFPVIAYPNPWTRGTEGPVTARAVISPFVDDPSPEALEGYRGQLDGTVVLMSGEPTLPLLFEPQAERLSQEELDRIAREGAASGPEGADLGRGSAVPARAGLPWDERLRFYGEEGVEAVLTASSRPPGGGTIFVDLTGTRLEGEDPTLPPVLAVAAEHYGRIYRVLERGIDVVLEVDVRNRWTEEVANGFNVLAEIPGGEREREVVTLGAHLDSWHLGTGATDNAAGVAVVMEAVRILKAVDLPMDRTVRLALWTGEEQGLLGSRIHVLRHYGSRVDPTPDHADFSLYLNVDNGAGAIRGISLQGNEGAEPIVRDWMRWVDSDSITVRHTSMRRAGGTDHLSFDDVGLPGFQFIQDPLEYGARTHHSSMDVYERVPEGDLQHNAVVLAVFAYLAATAPERFPRR